MIFLFATPLCILSQEVLTLNGAIEIALKSNYGIQMISNNADAAALLNTPGQAGILPSVRAGAADQYSSNNIFQRFASGQEISSPNASGNNLSAFVAMDWTIFSGFRLTAQRDRLAQLELMGKSALRAQIAGVVQSVTNAYLAIMRSDTQLENLDQLQTYNTLRVEIAQKGLEAGLISKSEFLQARVDLNDIRMQIQQAGNLREVACIELNRLLARDLSMPVKVEPEINFSLQTKDELMAATLQNNYDLALSRTEKLLAENQLKQVRSLQYPTLNLTGAYNFSRTDNSAGFSLLNRTYGPVAGLNLSVPLYAGGTLKRQKTVAEIGVKNSDLALADTEKQILADFETTYSLYRTVMEMIPMQEAAVSDALENLDILTARLKLGQSNALELRQAQLSYETALAKLTNLKYDLLQAQSRLLVLAGKF